MVEFLLPALSSDHSRTEVVDFRGHLLRHLPGKLLVVWDGLPAHRSLLVSEFIRAPRGRLALEGCRATPPNSIR